MVKWKVISSHKTTTVDTAKDLSKIDYILQTQQTTKLKNASAFFQTDQQYGWITNHPRFQPLVSSKTPDGNVVFFRGGPKRWEWGGTRVNYGQMCGSRKSQKGLVDAILILTKFERCHQKMQRCRIFSLSPTIMVQWKMAEYLKGNYYWRYTRFSSFFTEPWLYIAGRVVLHPKFGLNFHASCQMTTLFLNKSYCKTLGPKACFFFCH